MPAPSRVGGPHGHLPNCAEPAVGRSCRQCISDPRGRQLDSCEPLAGVGRDLHLLVGGAHPYGCDDSRNSNSAAAPSAGFVETPALAAFSECVALNRNTFTNAPTTRATSNCPKCLPGQTRGPWPKPKCKTSFDPRP